MSVPARHSRQQRNRLRARLRRGAVHLLVLAGLLPKLLVPVGFMPAPLASGSLLMLCDGFQPVPHTMPAAQPASATTGEHAAHPDAGTMHHGMHGAAADASESPEPDPADGAHDEWKRCSLGGLASLAALTHDYDFQLAAGHHAPAAILAIDGTSRNVLLAFRSRAPPLPA